MLNLSLLPDLQYNGGPALPPQKDDLEFLYQTVTSMRATTVLEFGCGYSTFVIAQALKENKTWFDALPIRPEVRNSKMFTGFSVDTNKDWLRECNKKINGINYFLSSCIVGLFLGQLCHNFISLPDIVPDFIYIDGPDPAQVIGDINGMTFGNCPERTPMAADILIMEYTLLPGTRILIDGRTNKARFLQRNLKRPWKCVELTDQDVTLMELVEPPLGNIIANGPDILRWLKNR